MDEMWDERALIAQLRAEAQSLKQCFTTFSFQAMSLAVTVLGLSLGALEKFPNAVFAPLPVVALLIAVCRIGIFKYSSANRHNGYELHLARTRKGIPSSGVATPLPWEEMRQVRWVADHPTHPVSCPVQGAGPGPSRRDK